MDFFHILQLILGLGLLVLALVDAFQTIILPRTVGNSPLLTGFYLSRFWCFWRWVANHSRRRTRDTMLSAYGPFALISLITLWAITSVLGFALVSSALRIPVSGDAGNERSLSYLISSGGDFFTLGSNYNYVGHLGSALAVAEAGLGFGFLAVVISYIPILTSTFSQREVLINLLDARAGTPPSALEIFKRYATSNDMESMTQVLKDWETWSAQLLESFLSHPLLAFFRSQHDRQSWLAAQTAILDVSALCVIGFHEDQEWAPALHRQAILTFAMGRHALVDLCIVLNTPPVDPFPPRLDNEQFQTFVTAMAKVGVKLKCEESTENDLSRIRESYEPYANALAKYLNLDLPEWKRTAESKDNWLTSSFEARDHFSGTPMVE